MKTNSSISQRPSLARLLVVGAILVATSAARAENAPFPCSLVTDPNNNPSTDPRVDHLVVAGVKVTVLVPPHYRTHGRRYPVLYLFHGAFSDQDSFTSQTDLITFTAGMRDHDQAIVVMPDGGHLPAGSDWVDGTHPQETYFIKTLVPFIDATYRSFGDRAHRAAAGFSGGGLDAMLYASRHPDLFVAAGSFSGFVDQLTPSGVAVIQQFAEVDNQLCGANNNPLGIWGDPVIHPMGWESHDPTFLAPNLGSLSIYIASGNGVPCPDDVAPDPFLMFAEATVFEMSQHLDAALTATGVSHVTDFYGCGLHLYSKVSRDLRHWWPQMLAAFGENDLGQAEDAGAPPTFDYRTGDTVAAVWGWQFRADPARAPEFLDIRHASVDRLRVTGSGAASFTTPPSFRPGESVSVAGAGPLPAQVRAGSDCRLTFTVDLGPPHSLEQGSTAELMAAAANPNYFVTRSVSLTRLREEEGESCRQ